MSLNSRWLKTASNGKRLQLYDGQYTAIGAAGIDFSTINSTALLHGAGSAMGDAVRSRISVSGTGIGYATGLHSTCQIAAGGTATGSSSGLRATYEAASATRTLSGSISALHLASYVGANNTMPTLNAYIRLTKDGSVDFDHFLVLPAAATNSTIFATHTTQTFSHSIRILDSAGTPYYIMCVDAATNRGGAS